MGKKTEEKPIEAVILLDACMPKMERCRSGCTDNPKILCLHRFCRNAHVRHGKGFVSFMRFYDFQIILYLIYPLISGKIKNISPNCRFVIVTKDGHFLKSAEKEWAGRKRSRAYPNFEFDPLEDKKYVITRVKVRNGPITISREIVVWAESINTVKGRDNIRRSVIDQLNRGLLKR